jgi:voltage-gated potassium channel
MIVIALMVLPVMGIEQLWPDTAVEFIQVATSLIWLAFTFEFLTMIGIVERKVRYCKEHWIDLAVILLPLIAFLRVARLGRLLRLQQLSKTARVYRIRGLMMRAYRAVLVLELVERLMRGTPEKQLAKLREQLAEKEQEVAALRSQIESLLAETAVVAEEPQRLAA